MRTLASLLAALSFLCGTIIHAQSDAPNQGVLAFSTHGGPPDNINLSNLHLYLKIPLFAKPGRGGVLHVGYSLVLDQPAVLPQPDVNLYVPYDPMYQWQVKSDFENATLDEPYVDYDSCGPYGPDQVIDASGYRLTDAGGIVRNFSLSYSDTSGCGSGGTYHWLGDGTAQDGSGYKLIPRGQGYSNFDLVYPSGVIQADALYGGQSLSDANGNIVSGGSDATGLALTTASSGNGTDYQYHDPDGNLRSTHIEYGTFTVQVMDHRGSNYPAVIYAHQVALPTSVSYADGSKYSFTYEPVTGGAAGAVTGRVQTVTLPTGASITYTYEGDLAQYFTLGAGNQNLDPKVLRRRVSTDAADTIYTTAGQAGNSYNAYTITTITTPEGNDTVIPFVGVPPYLYEYARSTYQGSGSGRVLLQNSQKCYDSSGSSCGYPVPGGPIGRIDTYITPVNTPTVRTATYYDIHQLVTSVDDYGFDSSPLRKAKIVYGTFGTAPHVIRDRPSTTGVQDGSGNWVAKTDYYYDAAGNRTDEYRFTNASSTVHVHSDYDSHGMVTNVNDPRGVGSRKIVYESSGTFPQSIETKNSDNTPVNGVSHATTYDYDINTGWLRSSTDPNGVTTTRRYDQVGRLISVKVPQITDGATPMETQFCFHLYGTATPSGRCSGTQNSLLTSVARASNQWIQKEQVYDGVGQKTAENNLSEGSHQDFSYSSDGMLHSASNPYFATTDPSAGTTTYEYDALQRLVRQSNPDGTSRTRCYNGQALSGQWCSLGSAPNASFVDDADEAGRKKQQQSDGLGRLSRVIEDVASVAIPTIYSYDLLDNLTDVNSSGVAGEVARTRHFSYDWLSRLLAARNPESGGGLTCSGAQGTDWGLCYEYDANSNVHAKRDARGVTTTYAYDAFDRVISKTFNDSVTPNEYWSYDVAPSWMSDLQNVVGRVANTNNAFGGQSGTSQAVAAAFSYDAMGRVKRKWEQTPSTSPGGYFLFTNYDLAGNPTSLSYPSGRTVVLDYDGAARLSSITQGSSAGSPYLSSATYHADGSPATLTYGNGVTETISQNSRLQICEATAIGSGQTFLDRQYFYGTNNTSGQQSNPVSGNAGNILAINDGLGGSYSQTFSYDSLNRLHAWTAPNMAGNYRHLDYLYDSFGNLVQSSSGPNVDPRPFFTSANRRDPGSFNCYGKSGETGGYDAAGNQVCSGTQNQDAKAFVWNAESGIAQVWGQQNNNTYNPVAGYAYNTDGQRARADQYNYSNNLQSWREYFYSDGLNVAQREQDGSWSDFIYAGGKRIARADNYDQRIVLEGDYPSSTQPCSACGSHAVGTAWLPNSSGYVIRSGDRLHFRQEAWTPSSSGGMYVAFCDGSTPNWNATDQDGNLINAKSGVQDWRTRLIDLSPYAGKLVCGIAPVVESTTGPGHFTLAFSDVAITNTDGSTVSLFARDPGLPLSVSFASGGVANLNVRNERGNIGAEINLLDTTLTYYVSDQVGTASLLVSGQGWPVWKGEFAPFGQELDSGGTANRNKFTGKERDQESGLDYFGARYYVSGIGRWSSPDWADRPYADLADPQSLNLYAYVRNNPLSNVDTDGHACAFVLRNDNSGFCKRAREYANIDANLSIRSQTRFFAAANAVSQALAGAAAGFPASLGVAAEGVSGRTVTFLDDVGQGLQGLNEAEAHLVSGGVLGGSGLDDELVHSEQSAVQERLDALQRSDPGAYGQVTGEINRALNPHGKINQGFASAFGTDAAFQGILGGVRKKLGRDIDFRRQSDRENMGRAVIDHIRQSRECDVTGSGPACQ